MKSEGGGAQRATSDSTGQSGAQPGLGIGQLLLVEHLDADLARRIEVALSLDFGHLLIIRGNPERAAGEVLSLVRQDGRQLAPPGKVVDLADRAQVVLVHR